MKVKVIGLCLVLFFAGVVVASPQDPNVGTWKLNEAKSRFSKGATKNHTVVYESAGDLDTTKVIVDGTDASGNATHNEWTGRFNGLYYAVTGDPGSDMRMYSRINNRTLSITAKKDGKVTLTGTITISRDGKSRTVTTSGTDANGRRFRNTAVYDKQ